MRPVDQTLFGVPEGNCLPACLASILEIPLPEIPNFCFLYKDDWENRGWKAYLAWMAERGLSVLAFGEDLTAWGEHVPLVPMLGVGTGPRGHEHCVIYKDGKMVWDPHPSRAGLIKVTSTELILYCGPSTVNKSGRLG